MNNINFTVAHSLFEGERVVPRKRRLKRRLRGRRGVETGTASQGAGQFSEDSTGTLSIQEFLHRKHSTWSEGAVKLVVPTGLVPVNRLR
jgi:hypothetical protein